MIKFSRRKALFFLFATLLQWGYISAAQAQMNNFRFTHLSSTDGLSSNIVNTIIKDKQGFLWFGTQEGLNKYNGNEFKVYRQHLNDTLSLQSNEITASFEDSKGIMWIGTAGGALHYYDRKKDGFIQIKAGAGNNQLNSNIIKSIAEDPAGNIWVGTFNGLNIIRRPGLQVTRFTAASDPVMIKSGLIKCIFKDYRNRMWVGTQVGLFLYEPRHQRFREFKHNNADPGSLSDDMVRTLGEDSKRRLWIGTEDGLCRLNEKEGKFTVYRYNSNEKTSLSNNRIYTFNNIDENHIWIGTDDGLNLMETESGRFTRYGPDERNHSSLTNKSIRSLYIDNRGITWVGTYEGGVNKLDRNLTFFGLKQSNPYDPYKLSDPFVTSFAQRTDGKIYIGTNGGGLNLYDPQTEIFKRIAIQPYNKVTSSNIAILAAALGKDGKLWMGTYQDGLFCLNAENGSYQQFTKNSTKNGLNNNDIFCLEVDHTGQVWIGTNGGGVNVYNPLTHHITQLNELYLRKGQATVPAKAYIRAIKEDKNGRIWIGTLGTGIAVVDPQKRTLDLYNKSNGLLPSDKIMAIHQDRKGNMWIGTGGDGLILLNSKSRTFRIFKEKEGLLSSFIQTIVEDDQGRIWVSTNKGVSYLDNVTKRLVNFTHHNGLQSNVFVHGAGTKLKDGILYIQKH
jgi:ligand-binding sensor domain-containing protein